MSEHEPPDFLELQEEACDKLGNQLKQELIAAHELGRNLWQRNNILRGAEYNDALVLPFRSPVRTTSEDDQYSIWLAELGAVTVAGKPDFSQGDFYFSKNKMNHNGDFTLRANKLWYKLSFQNPRQPNGTMPFVRASAQLQPLIIPIGTWAEKVEFTPIKDVHELTLMRILIEDALNFLHANPRLPKRQAATMKRIGNASLTA